MYIKHRRRIISLILAVALSFTISSPAEALTGQTGSCVTFYNIGSLALGESIKYGIVDSSGYPAAVGITKVPASAAGIEYQPYNTSAANVYQVWYSGILGRVEFYMTVSNNKVTSVYDDSISLLGGTYDNATLSKTSTYGKLTFTLKVAGDIFSKTCWLRGTVTGKDNDITVDWDM